MTPNAEATEWVRRAREFNFKGIPDGVTLPGAKLKEMEKLQANSHKLNIAMEEVFRQILPEHVQLVN
eukprot:2492192-Amphidinium_carterae.2